MSLSYGRFLARVVPAWPGGKKNCTAAPLRKEYHLDPANSLDRRQVRGLVSVFVTDCVMRVGARGAGPLGKGNYVGVR